MSAKTFVDTNLLVYAHHLDAGHRHHRAKEVLRELWEEQNGKVSLQVLQEFYVTVTRRISSPLAPAAARTVVRSYVSWCIEPDLSDLATAFRIEDEAGLSFWDALILASAARGGAVRLLSEDLNPGQTVFGVLIENPFRAAS
jgi:predicted nucleic acid-binding protein